MKKTLRRSLLIIFTALFAVTIALFAAACTDPKDSETVNYTVEVYLAEDDAYVLNEEHSQTGSGKVGESVTVTPPAVEGYTYNASHTENVSTLILSEDAAENVFKLYYDVEGEDIPPQPTLGGVLSYSANAPRGTTARGSVASSRSDSEGNVTVAQNGYTITGYRFAGWSTRADGTVEYAVGSTITLHGDTTLYAIWDRGLTDRFGGNDYIYLPSQEEGVAILERGGLEFVGTTNGETFLFEFPNGERLEGRIFGTTFTYRRNEIEGTYYFYNSYMPADYTPGSATDLLAGLDRTETLYVDPYSDAVHTYIDPETNTTVRQTGSVIYNSYSDEYMFTDTEGNGFVYALGVLPGDIPVFYATYGEGGLYYEMISPDGVSGYYGSYDLILDGYGSITYYDFIEGGYYVENIYDNGYGVYMYKIAALVSDPYEINDFLGMFPQSPDYTDEDGINWYWLYFYTMPMSDGSYGFVAARPERGHYESDLGALDLDGYGILPDSAIYTAANGATYYGNYTLGASPRDPGTIIHFTVTDVTTGAPTTNTFTFMLDGDSFVGYGESDNRQYTEYIWLHDSTLSYEPLLVVYDENVTANGKSGRLAEIYVYDENDEFTLAATGCLVSEQMKGSNGVILYTFIKTESVAVYGDEVADELVMMLDMTYDGNYVPRDIYVVFERDGKPTYTVIEEASGSGAQIWYQNVGVNTIGSIYIDENGNYYAGGFTVDLNGYYFGPTGYFIYYEGVYVQILYFELTMDGNGNPATFRETSETEYPVYRVDFQGNFDTNVTLLIRGEEAMYSATGDFENAGAYTRGYIEIVDFTDYGDPIYQLVSDGGVTVFRFIMDIYYYQDLAGIYEVTAYYLFNTNVNGEYGTGREKLTLDGFHRATYLNAQGVAVEGTYYLSADGTAVFFTGAGGESYLFDISGDELNTLDGAYGSWALYIHGGNVTLVFDGRGNLDAYSGNSLLGSGFYDIVSENPLACEIFINFGTGAGVEQYTVSFNRTRGECIILQENARGVFISEDWAILVLDGYGNGTYYAADGSTSRTGYVTIIDAADNFAMLRYSDYSADLYFTFDPEAGTFGLPNYAKESYVYLTENFFSIAFGTNGIGQVGTETGPYNITNGKAKIYLQSAVTGTYTKYEFPVPTGEDVYVVEGEQHNANGTYYRFRGGDITLNGTILVDADGFENITGVTLSFTLSSSYVNANATLVAGGVSYQLVFVNRYWSYEQGRNVDGPALYEASEYAYYPINVSYIPSGLKYADGSDVQTKSGFTAEGGLIQNRLTDYNDDGSTLTEVYIGWGPVRLDAMRLSGNLRYGNYNLSFTGAEVSIISVDVSTGTTRYLAPFEVNGEGYAIIYEKDIYGYYVLYMLVRYNEVNTGDYIVGVHRYLYSNDGYVFYNNYRVGDFSGVTLYKKNGDTRSVVTAFNAQANSRNNTAWMIPEDGVYETGYFFEVTFDETTGNATAVTLTEYGFVQAMTYDGNSFVNIFLGEDGKPEMLVAMLTYDAESYLYFMNIASVEQKDDWTFVVTDVDDNEYEVTVVRDENGDPLVHPQGYWLVDIVLL